jgi:gamma-glutamylcyclotransferase (GGCT)/AIG2-like uncharacterized protein YtfP
MPLTFAYGSNMDAQAMAARCPGARLIGRARLPRHRVDLMPGGFATLVRDASATAQGALWELSFGDLAALDRYEGAGYAKISQPVLREKGAAVRALIYVGKSGAGAGRAPEDYMRNLIEAARALGLPRDYIDGLRRLAGESPEPVSRFRAIKNPQFK